MTVNILGTEYSVEFMDEMDSSGKIEFYLKNIKIKKHDLDSDLTIAEGRKLQFEVIKHEIIHAFLYESGLYCDSASIEHWATNEEMIDWIAIQFDKIRIAIDSVRKKWGE